MSKNDYKTIAEYAASNPEMLTKALREAGNFCYIIVPEDILNYDDYQHEGQLGITLEEAQNVLKTDDSLGDDVDYDTIINNVVERIKILRKQTKPESK